MHNNTGDDTLDTLLHAISGVLTLILMGLIGCVLAELGWINDTNKSILPKLINYVSLPCSLCTISHIPLAMTNYFI